MAGSAGSYQPDYRSCICSQPLQSNCFREDDQFSLQTASVVLPNRYFRQEKNGVMEGGGGRAPQGKRHQSKHTSSFSIKLKIFYSLQIITHTNFNKSLIYKSSSSRPTYDHFLPIFADTYHHHLLCILWDNLI